MTAMSRNFQFSTSVSPHIRSCRLSPHDQTRRQFSSQSEDEIRAFRHFLQKADINIDPDSIVKRQPPEPDILCRLADGSRLAFELVELVNRKNVAGFEAAPPRSFFPAKMKRVSEALQFSVIINCRRAFSVEP